MKLYLNEGQEVSESYKNALIASKLAIRKWRRKFLNLWKKYGRNATVIHNGDEYIGGAFTMDRVYEDHQKEMSELLGFDEAMLSEFQSFMNQDGVQDIDIIFSPRFCTNEYCIATYLEQIYGFIDYYVLNGGGSYSVSVVTAIHDLPENGRWNVNGAETVFDMYSDAPLAFSSIREPMLNWNMDAILYSIERVMGIFASYGFVTTETLDGTYEYDSGQGIMDVDTYHYDVLTFRFSAGNMPYFLTHSATSTAVHEAMYHGDTIDAYFTSYGEYSEWDYKTEYAFFERLSWSVAINTDHTYLIENRYYVKISWLQSLSGHKFTEFIGTSIEINTSSASSWPFAGTFLGDVLDTLKGLLAALAGGLSQIDNLPIVNGFYYTAYYTLQFIGLSQGDLDNLEMAYRKARTAALVFVFTGGAGNAAQASTQTAEEIALNSGFIDVEILSDAALEEVSLWSGEGAVSAMLGNVNTLNTTDMISQLVDLGVDIYTEINMPQLPNVIDEAQEDVKDGLDIVRGSDDFDAFYEKMVYDPSEMELEDYFEDPYL